ncbi:MAG: hypothetical protein AAB512_05465 [Patescibacteria group bacterium]
MTEDHESGSGHQDPKAENHIVSDRKSQHNFFEGRHIDHHMGEGTETPGRVRRLINRFYELRGKRKETRQLPSNETARRMAERMDEETPEKLDPDYTPRNKRTFPFMKMNIPVHHRLMSDAQKEKHFGDSQTEKPEPKSEE